MRWPLVWRTALEDVAERRDLMREDRDVWRERALKAEASDATSRRLLSAHAINAAKRSPGKPAPKKRKAR